MDVSLSQDPPNFGQIDLKLWADDRKAAISLTFDDGFLCHYTHLRPILNQYGFPGTFYLITERLTEDLTQKPIGAYGYWDHFTQMAQEGHEIGSHSASHPYLHKLEIGTETAPGTLTYELLDSKDQIEAHIPFMRCNTFAYPYASSNKQIADLTRKYYLAARSVGSQPNSSSIPENNLMNLRSIGLQWNKARAKPEDDLPKLDLFTKWVEKNVISTNSWVIFVAHEVLPFSELKASTSWEPTTTEWFQAFCAWLHKKTTQKELWIETVGNIVKYIKERDNFSYKVLSTSNTKIEIKIENKLNSDLYDIPVTADIFIPTNWDNVTLIQGTTEIPLIPQTENSINYVRTEILPKEMVISLIKG